RVATVNPLMSQSQTCPWTDPNGNNIAELSEIVRTQCTGFPGLTSHYADANGPDWPSSDEITAGIERQWRRDVGVGEIYSHRTNGKKVGVENVSVPPAADAPAT